MPRKYPKLEHVRYVTTRGKLYAYFNTGRKDKKGRPVYAPLPSPSNGSFFQSYGAMKAARDRRVELKDTFANLADDYQNSAEFASRSEGTRKTYRSVLREAVKLLGSFQVDEVDTTMIRIILDERDWSGAKQNLFVATVGVVYKWGRARGRTEANPVKGIETAATGEHKAWPDDVLEAALADEGRGGLAVALLLYTGQRIGDVCKMRWNMIRDDAITLIQQKTRKRLTIHLHRDLRARLEALPKTGLTILTNERGGAVQQQAIRDEVKALAGQPDLKPHGLRKNAVNALLRARCTVAEVAAITGQSFAVVEYYARQIDQERMGRCAILQWEQTGKVQTGLQQPRKGGINQ